MCKRNLTTNEEIQETKNNSKNVARSQPYPNSKESLENNGLHKECRKQAEMKLQTWDWKSKSVPSNDKREVCSCEMLSNDLLRQDMDKFLSSITQHLSETQREE